MANFLVKVVRSSNVKSMTHGLPLAQSVPRGKDWVTDPVESTLAEGTIPTDLKAGVDIWQVTAIGGPGWAQFDGEEAGPGCDHYIPAEGTIEVVVTEDDEVCNVVTA